MKEFLPWANATYNTALKKYRNGQFSIIDVQLSGECNYNCIYCDSPDRKVSSKVDYDYLCNLIKKHKNVYDWMFICGLGEPLFNTNKLNLLKLLECCKNQNIKCSIFTNGSGIDDTILQYVKEGVLYPLIKIDTFSLDLSQKLYGTKEAHKTLRAIDELFNIANSIDSEYSHIAASIVPTTKNISEIPQLVNRCIENNIFPLLGQLEYAGKAINSYNELLLSKDELLKLKKDIEMIIGEKYRIPVCPSVIAGIHISSNGYITVDKRSGLSCSWFWLETPDTVDIEEFNKIKNLSVAELSILNYRKSVFKNIVTLEQEIEEYPFGGCGGNIKDLLKDYADLQSDLYKKSGESI